MLKYPQYRLTQSNFRASNFTRLHRPAAHSHGHMWAILNYYPSDDEKFEHHFSWVRWNKLIPSDELTQIQLGVGEIWAQTAALGKCIDARRTEKYENGRCLQGSKFECLHFSRNSLGHRHKQTFSLSASLRLLFASTYYARSASLYPITSMSTAHSCQLNSLHSQLFPNIANCPT